MPEPTAPPPVTPQRPATFRTLIPIYNLSVLCFSKGLSKKKRATDYGILQALCCWR